MDYAINNYTGGDNQIDITNNDVINSNNNNVISNANGGSYQVSYKVRLNARDKTIDM